MFQEYIHKSTTGGRIGKNSLSIQTSGGMSLGKQIVEEHGLENAKNAVLLYDKGKDQIAIRFLEEYRFGCMPIAKVSNSRYIRPRGFSEQFSIDPGEYHLLEKQETGMFIFGRISESIAQARRYVVVDLPANVQDADFKAVLDLVQAERV